MGTRAREGVGNAVVQKETIKYQRAREHTEL